MEHHAEHVPTIASLLWPVVNFGIFVAVLVRFLGGPLREFFRARAERLREELAAGDRARREAEALRAQLAKDVADLPFARERLKADVLATAARERDQLLAQGRQTSERIRRDAVLLGEQLVASARRALRDELVAAAVREATDLVRSATQAPDQERFVREFVERAGASS
jgi:F0F1-type ATP synthase membrane subunit b/b'